MVNFPLDRVTPFTSEELSTLVWVTRKGLDLYQGLCQHDLEDTRDRAPAFHRVVYDPLTAQGYDHEMIIEVWGYFMEHVNAIHGWGLQHIHEKLEEVFDQIDVRPVDPNWGEANGFWSHFAKVLSLTLMKYEQRGYTELRMCAEEASRMKPAHWNNNTLWMEKVVFVFTCTYLNISESDDPVN